MRVELTEVKCHDSHIQFFVGNVCVGTVRAEYADAFREALAKRGASLANRDDTEK